MLWDIGVLVFCVAIINSHVIYSAFVEMSNSDILKRRPPEQNSSETLGTNSRVRAQGLAWRILLHI